MNSPRTPNWHDDCFFGIHYDLHATADDTDFGAALSGEHLRQRLAQVQPDWIQCDCKGHKGYCSYPTTVGSPAPGLVGDPLETHRRITREMGIRLGVHYSGVWDARAIELHPDWARIDQAGNPDPRITCRHSDYLEAMMIPQLVEIIDRYDVDGFWVDGDNWASKPCWCDRCRNAFRDRTGHEAPTEAATDHWHMWLAFHRELFIEYVERWVDAVHERKPDCVAISSYIYGARQPDPRMRVNVDCLSGDLDFRWGAEHALLESRVFDARDRGFNLMAWMQTKPGEMTDPRPWMVKPTVHLCQELSEVIAHGGAAMVYEKPQRCGHLTGWHHDRIAAVADYLRARRPWCRETTSASDVAILHFADHFYRHNTPLYEYEPGTEPIEGALAALLEHHRTVDVLTEDAAEARMDQYRMLVVPEITGIGTSMLDRLKQYAARGGRLLITGSHLAHECADLVGARPDGEALDRGVYLHVPGRDITIPIPTHGPADGPAPGRIFPWQPVAIEVSDTQAIAWRHDEQEPHDNRTDQVLITRRDVGRGCILAAHGPLFSGYFNTRYPELRRLIGELVDGLNVDWLVRPATGADMPPTLELIARRRHGELLIHMLNRGPSIVLPPKRILIEHLPPIHNAALEVQLSRRPVSTTLEPGGIPIETTWHDGHLTVTIPKVDVHEVLVVRE